MTTVYLEESREAYVIEAEGHATGNQDVCAALSMLLTMAANWTVASGYEEEQVLSDGYARVVIPRELRGARTVFNLIKVGIDGLEKNFGDFVKKGTKFGQD